MNERDFEKLRNECETLKKRVDWWQRDQDQVSGALPPLFPVTLIMDGGSAGDATTECDYTYEVYDLAGVLLKTDVALSTARPIVAAMDEATKGSAYITADGELFLWWCDEQQQTEICTGG